MELLVTTVTEVSPPFLGVPQIWRSWISYKSIAVSFCNQLVCSRLLATQTRTSARKTLFFLRIFGAIFFSLINSLPGALEKLRQPHYRLWLWLHFCAVTVSSTGPRKLFKCMTTATLGVLARFPWLLPVRNSFASYGASAITRTSDRGHVAEAKDQGHRSGGVSIRVSKETLLALNVHFYGHIPA